MSKPAILKDVGGTLTFAVPETGTVAVGAVVDLYDHRGTTIATGRTAIIGTAPSRLSCTISAGEAATLGMNYRALWRYTAGSTPCRRNQTFDVAHAIIYPPITTAAQLAKHFPMLELRPFKGTATIDDLGVVAWDDVCERIVSMGKEPNLLIDPEPLKGAYAAIWAAHVARNYRAGNEQTNDWQAFADKRMAEFSERMDAVFSNLRWYDANEDTIPDEDEENISGNTIFLSR